MSLLPRKLTHRQERFCRAFVDYGSARTAGLAAGYAPGGAARHGYRLLRQPRIRARIAQTQAKIAGDACRDTATRLGKLETVSRRVLDDHNVHAAARTVALMPVHVYLGQTKPDNPLKTNTNSGK